LDGVVDRKVVKQSVMTSVYGVTFIGVRKQVQARLEEKLMATPAQQTPEMERAIYKASLYLAAVTIEQIGSLFSEANAIMDWLTQCARLVSLEGETMSWLTPLGLPVVQPYRQQRSFTVQTLLQVPSFVYYYFRYTFLLSYFPSVIFIPSVI
jgi:DNA-directed RNA polymerase